MKNKYETIIMCIVIFVFLIPIMIVGLILYRIYLKPTDISTNINQVNGYKIVFKQIGETGWPFGPTKVKVVLLNNKNRKIKSFSDYIANDGKTVDEYNIAVRWFDDRVNIILIGEEQKNKTYELKY